MHINKFKKTGKDKYRVCFDNEEVTLYEDIILKYDLLIKKDIDIEELNEIINENMYYEAYNLSLSYIEFKMRCESEISNYLDKKGYTRKYIDYAINKLKELDLINPVSYIKAYVNDKINLTLDGPFKIKRQLLELDLNESDIDNYLDTIKESVWSDKLDKLINKRLKIMNNKSYYMFINKMKNDLYNLGYDKELINDKLSKIEYNSDAIIKEIEHAKRKYPNDKTKLINYLLRKGYNYEEINSNLKEQ